MATKVYGASDGAGGRGRPVIGTSACVTAGRGTAVLVARLCTLLAAELAAAGLRRQPAQAPGALPFFRACTCGVVLDLAAHERVHAALDRAWRRHAKPGCADLSPAAALELHGEWRVHRLFHGGVRA